MTGVSIVLCTAPAASAAALADRLLLDGLVACVNLVGPVESRYVWQGALEKAQETLMVMKTGTGVVAALRQRIVELHEYDVPEVVELQVTSGHDAYLQWVLAACAGQSRMP